MGCRVCSCFALLLTICVTTAADVRSCALSGRVLDPDGRAVAQASVNVVGSALASTYTDQAGRYELCTLAPGEYTISIAAAGFSDAVETVVVGGATQADRTTRLSIALLHSSVTVAAPEPSLHDALDISEERESTAKDIGEALSRLDGIWKVRRGAIANDVIVRGFQRDNINVLVDGARIHGACPNRMDPAAYHVDFAEVERVTVVRGAFDVTGQGSLGALVNVVTKTSPLGFQFKPTFTAGSFNSYNPALTASFGGDRLRALAGYSWRTGDAYETGAGRKFTRYANYSLRADPLRAFDIHTGWFSLGTVMGPHEVDIRYTRQQGGVGLYPYLLMDAKYDNADRVTLKYGQTRGGRVSRLGAEAYVTQVHHYMTDEYRSSAPASGFGMATNAASRVMGGNIRADAGAFSFGVDGLVRRWDAVNYMRMQGMWSAQNVIPDVQTGGGGAYVTFRRQLSEQFSVAGATRFDAITSSASRTAATALYQAYHGHYALSMANAYPSGNVRFSVRLLKVTNLLVGFGSTARVPDAQERFFAQKKMGQDVVGNPNLPPVRNSEFTAGLNLRRGASYLRSTLYYSFLSNYITPYGQQRQQMAPGVMNSVTRSYENVTARMYGGELSCGWRAAESLLFSCGAGWTRGTKEPRPQVLIFDRDLLEMPPVRAWTSLRYTQRLWFAELEFVAAGRQRRVDSDVQETPTAGYGLVNLKAGLHTKRLYLTVSMDNVLNRFYYEHFSYSRDPFRSGVKIPEPGRNVWSMLACRF